MKPLPRALFVLAAAAFLAATAGGQTLEILPAGDGGEVLVVAFPLSDAYGLAWAATGEDGSPEIRSEAGPALMAASAIERVLGGGEGAPLPPVLVVTGAVRPDEISGLVADLSAGRAPAAVPRTAAAPMIEGGVDRRLAPPGAGATLRLRIPLPARDDPLRSPAEVLATLLPALAGAPFPGLAVRLDADDALLTLPVEPELAEGRLGRLRLALARFADDPEVEAGVVERARRRLAVRRLVTLASTPEGAETVVRWWLAGGDAAVRELLFGLEGVGPRRVAEAARRWLAVHPGAAELLLPPRVLNPRFAAGPEEAALPSGTTAMLLERPATPLEAVVVRPVLTPDLDGGATASVLARLAAAIRQSPEAPGWVEVRREPPRLELAVPAGDVPTLLEALGTALEQVGADTTPVAEPAGPEARALALMADALGLTGEGPLTPARLLGPDNLALGMLVTDAEAAREALHKLLGEAPEAAGSAVATDLPTAGRTRVAVSGTTSSLVVRLDGADGSPAAETALALLRSRAEAVLADARIRLVRPRVPGAAVALLVVTAKADFPALEKRLGDAWSGLTAPPGEDAVEAARRTVLERVSRRWSGPVGRAALMAAVAAGQRAWSPPSRWQTRLLTVSAEDVAAVLEGWSAWDRLGVTGAGPLPVAAVPLPPAGVGH